MSTDKKAETAVNAAETEKKENEGYDIAYDNLAIPEIHTGRAEPKAPEKPEDESVTYDTLAIPEIHIRKKKPQ